MAAGKTGPQQGGADAWVISTIADAWVIYKISFMSRFCCSSAAKHLHVDPPPLPQADLALALPPWTYQYRRGLSSDNSRAVRAEAAALTGELVAAAGRMAAPHLKQLAGPWWVWGRGEEGKWSRVRVHALLGSW